MDAAAEAFASMTEQVLGQVKSAVASSAASPDDRSIPQVIYDQAMAFVSAVDWKVSTQP